MLAVTLTLGTMISVLFLCVGGIIGWLYKEHIQRTVIPQMHPEMYDERGRRRVTIMTMTEVHPELGEARLPNNPLLSEVLDKVSKQRTKAKKVQVLKENESLHLKSVLIWNFDDSIVSILPEGDVPFNKNEAPAGTEHTYLAHEWKILYNFVKGGNDFLRPIKREQMFLQLLEGLHPDEAEIICLVKDKKLTTKYKVTREMVQEAFPDIVWGNRGG
jgi:hypothetical protein